MKIHRLQFHHYFIPLDDIRASRAFSQPTRWGYPRVYAIWILRPRPPRRADFFPLRLVKSRWRSFARSSRGILISQVIWRAGMPQVAPKITVLERAKDSVALADRKQVARSQRKESNGERGERVEQGGGGKGAPRTM